MTQFCNFTSGAEPLAPWNFGMSAVGTKRTLISTLNMSAFRGKADISDRLADVRSVDVILWIARACQSRARASLAISGTSSARLRRREAFALLPRAGVPSVTAFRAR